MDKEQNKLIFEKSAPGRRAYSLPRLAEDQKPAAGYIPEKLCRTQPPVLPEVSELDLTRHYIQLSQSNFSVDTHFYPLGSCTMKFNPRLNEKVSMLPGFTRAHPLQPDRLSQGLLHILYDLEQYLCELSGMDAYTLQPAAGAHGELTALLMTRAYHNDKGAKKNKIIVPDSSHGSNPSSAALAGFEVITIPSRADGLIDQAALANVLDEHTAAFMVTNPNTVGIFEKEIMSIAEAVHKVGALLYCDGANFNALAGICRPGDLGFDIMHLNLHKTFSTPHGAGGPGAGPVGVKSFLKPYLPAPVIKKQTTGVYAWNYDLPKTIGKMRGFYGNIGVLIKAYTYIRSLGKEGFYNTAVTAVLNANYLKAQLQSVYEIPLNNGPCMHEFVISAKNTQSKNGVHVSALEIAKKLIDYGIHPPTIYFPLIVPEALMIEPTETESKETLDRFIAVMKEIAQTIAVDPDSVKHAPDTTAVQRPDEVTAARTPIVRYV